MNKRNNYNFGKRIKYFFNSFLSKGFWAQILVLLLTVFVLTLIFGIITMNLSGETYPESYWISLMHIIDQGTVTSDEKGTDFYFLFMLFITFIGMAITGTIVAIFTSSIQGKLDEQKKGHSKVIEKGHVVILGFDENAYTICSELAEGSLSKGERLPLVIADRLDIDEMEQAANDYYVGKQQYIEKSQDVPKRDKKLKIIFRSGDPISENTFSMCMVQTAKAIIVNRESDFDTIRILISLATYLKRNNAYLESESMPFIIAMIHNEENLEAALIAAGIDYKNGVVLNKKNANKIQIAYDKYIQANLFAMSCINHEMPLIIDSLFNYRGSSIQIEDGNPFLGKNISEISDMVTDAIPLGFAKTFAFYQTEISLAPSKDQTCQADDLLICLSRNNKLHIGTQKHADSRGIPAKSHSKEKKTVRNFLLIGSNISLADMMGYMNEYCLEGSTANLISSEEIDQRGAEGSVISTSVTKSDNPYDFENIKNIFEENCFWLDETDSRHLTNIVILSPKDDEKALADEKVMLLLLRLRQYLKETDATSIRTTCVMQLLQNQMLLQRKNDGGFVATAEISNRMLAQITDEPVKYRIIEEFLNQKDICLDLNPVSDYVDIQQAFNFEGVFSIAKASGSTVIPLGWIQTEAKTDKLELILNPAIEELEKCYVGDAYTDCQLIILRSKN